MTGAPTGAVLPATDSVSATPAGPSNDNNLPLALLAMAGLLAATLLLTPAKAAERRKDR